MIIWLASYPKSGNTWVKIFLNSILFSKDQIDINKNNIRLFPLRSDFNTLNVNIDNIKEFADNCLNAQNLINIDNKIKFFKTHNALWKLGEKTFTNEDNTLGVLHIVRDPRNLVTSLSNHSSITIDEGLVGIGNNDSFGNATVILNGGGISSSNTVSRSINKRCTKKSDNHQYNLGLQNKTKCRWNCTTIQSEINL